MSDQKNDQALCQAIRKWKETAVDLVDDIAGWRACPGERFWHTPWRGLPGGFRSLTIQLTAEAANFPGLDCAPVMAVYRAVETWHADHDAGRLPEQSAITADLNAAAVTLGVIEAAIENRTSDKPEVTVEAEPEPDGPRVVLRGYGEPPIVGGRAMPTLTNAQHDVISALLKAGPKGLTKDALDGQSCHGDSRKILRRVADKYPEWKAVISFPGSTGKRYRIL